MTVSYHLTPCFHSASSGAMWPFFTLKHSRYAIKNIQESRLSQSGRYKMAVIYHNACSCHPILNRSYRRRRRSCRCETFGGRHEGVENKSQSCPVPYQILSEKAAEFMQINLRTEDWMEAPPATSRFQPIDAGGLKSWLHNVLETFAKCIFANYVVHLH